MSSGHDTKKVVDFLSWVTWAYGEEVRALCAEKIDRVPPGDQLDLKAILDKSREQHEAKVLDFVCQMAGVPCDARLDLK